MPKLIEIVPSGKKHKKFDAVFQMLNSGKKRIVSFGAKGYEDYTQHRDKSRRENYRQRHRHDRLNDPMSPGALSYFILWGDSTSLNENLRQFRRKFRV